MDPTTESDVEMGINPLFAGMYALVHPIIYFGERDQSAQLDVRVTSHWIRPADGVDEP
jgi:hypothetical protein